MKNIIFDWSGVVRDTIESQIWIVNKLFKVYGVPEISTEEFRENWEQPYELFYQKYLPSDYIEEERVKLYKELVFDSAGPKSRIFPGMRELIKKCKDNGMFLAVVSSDIRETLINEAKEWELESCFDLIITDSSNKLESVQKLITDNKLNLAETCFVGDSNHEIDVARETGIKSVAVTWGFVSERKLKANSPDFVAHNIEELESVIFPKI